MRRERGITTIGLVVTIIVMLILAGVTISLMQGNSGIISKADESKSQTERKEVIEKAKMTISEKVVNNGGNELTRSELKEILEQYFINVPEDYTLETILKTKEENGKYEIKVSEIYDREFWGDDEETPDNPVTPPEPTPTNPTTQPTTSDTGGDDTSGSKEIDVTKVEMDKQTATVDINGENTVQLNAKVIPSNANKNTEITWTSKKKAVASVNQKGLVTGKTVGNSMIMATSQNGYSADCLVVCQAKITGITVNPVTANMTVGQKIILTATTSPEIVTEKVTWKSRNEDVAKVDNNGNVTGIGKGVVEIIAQNPGGTIQAVCTVTVKINPTGIRLNYSKLVLDKNSSNIPKLEATILPDTTYVNNSIVWDSSNKNVVTVENGNLTLIGNGEAQITVTTQNGYTAQCSVTVITSITSLSVSPKSQKLIKGQTIQLNSYVEPANTTEGTSWISGNKSVATVNSNGLVTAIGVGTVTITLKASGSNVSDSCNVTVTAGGYIVGLGDQIWSGTVLKLDSNGQKQWSYRTNNMCNVNSVIETSDGGYMAGLGDQSNSGSVLKLDSSGQKQWSYRETNMCSVNSVNQTSDGGYIVGLGDQDQSNTGSVLKLNSSGQKQWSYRVTNMCSVNSVNQTSDGGYIVGLGDQIWSGTVLKLDSNGQKQWSYRTNNMCNVNSVIETSDGGYMAGLGDQIWSGTVLKLDSNGQKQWSYRTNNMCNVNSVAQTY